MTPQFQAASVGGLHINFQLHELVVVVDFATRSLRISETIALAELPANPPTWESF
jgi:hypothetical protein